MKVITQKLQKKNDFIASYSTNKKSHTLLSYHIIKLWTKSIPWTRSVVAAMKPIPIDAESSNQRTRLLYESSKTKLRLAIVNGVRNEIGIAMKFTYPHFLLLMNEWECSVAMTVRNRMLLFILLLILGTSNGFLFFSCNKYVSFFFLIKDP